MMGPNIEDALHQGITAHQSGNLQEAKRVYQSILRRLPRHPDVNHNLGLIAISMNQIQSALPLFKIALEANPNIEQFWLSYIDALVKNNQLKDAKQAIKKAKKKGFDAKKLQAFVVQSKGAIGTTVPSQELVNSLFGHYQNGQFTDAEKLCLKIIKDFPKYQFAWKVLGAVLGATGRKAEAVDANQKAVLLSNQDPEAHSNLGIALQELGKFDEAAESYKKALSLRSDYAEAHNNLGICLKKLGRLDEAGRSFSQAIASRPDYADAYINLSLAIENANFKSSNRDLYPPLTKLLTTENLARPMDMASGILSLLKHDRLIKDLQFERDLTISLKKATYIIKSLDKLPLLHQLMRVCPLPELQFEKLFVALRSFLLKNLATLEVYPELIYFLSTLAIHCFVNEYVYAERDDETSLVEGLKDEIERTLALSEHPEIIRILCLATYRPLNRYNWHKNLEALDNLKEVRARLIEEPHAEERMAQDIPKLGRISDHVSLKVKGQYEENPYPRWMKLGIPIKAKSISEVCDEMDIHLHSKNIKKVASPTILIAGCGTGQHSIGTAARFSNCHITAVDLSLASLAYARRKSVELGLTNLAYLQADILNLGLIEQRFDIIESLGVLHHMEDPIFGWKILVDLLKSGGLMRIGLYSELARKEIVKARREIASFGIGTSAAEIRNFRQSISNFKNNSLGQLASFGDFYSLSEFRDLVFHVQEHRFTLKQIKDYIDELGLKFCGFDNRNVVSNFREHCGNDVDIYDLELWHGFEENYPTSFAAMYQFWCQKP